MRDHGLTFRAQGPPGAALSIPRERGAAHAAMRVRLGRIPQSDGNRGPSEWTRAVQTKGSEVVPARWTTAVKIVRIRPQTGLRNVETTVETTTTIVETTTKIVVDTHEG